jgi:hypothetical protein
MRFVRVFLLALVAALVLVPAALAIRFSDGSLLPPSGVEGQPYFHKLDATGGCNEQDYEFRVIAGTSLPPGLVLRGSSTDWRIEGTPAAAGEWTIWLQMWSDGNADCAAEEASPEGRRTAERAITIKIGPGLKIEQTQANFPTATVGVPYGPLQLTASGGGTQSWSATEIPAGLSLSPSGVLSGTPTAKSGDSRLTARVQDTSGRVNVVTYALPVRDPLTLNAQPTPRAEVGRPFTVGFAALGGNEAYTWEAASLPAGLAFDQARRALTGVPTAAGTFAAKVTVRDGEGRVVTRDVAITVAPKLAIATRTLKAGKAGKRYVVRFTVRGGVGPVQWRLMSFRPGARIAFNRASGTLTFTPGAPRTYRIVVRATDALKAISTQTLTLRVTR